MNKSVTTMTELARIGEIEIIPNGLQWKIVNFLTHSEPKFWSPFFTFGNHFWCLGMSPYGDISKGSFGYIDLHLGRLSAGSPINVDFSFALKTSIGIKYQETYYTGRIFEEGKYHDCLRFIPRAELSRQASELVPFGMLTVTVTFMNSKSAASASHITTAECSYCKGIFDAGNISSHTKKCMDRPIKCPECSKVILLQNWYDHECQTSSAQAFEQLSNDMKEMMLSGLHSDMTIKMKGEEFRLHKNILAARNPFFHAMLNNDMKENATGVVSIEDCEPDVFRSFIHFVYTGKVDKVSPENVCGLYEVAEKYQEDQLKKDCLHFMMNTISGDNLCDYIALALRHDEKKLLQVTTKFFAKNTKEIIRSVKWQNFLLEYPIQANELHIKALDFSDDK